MEPVVDELFGRLRAREAYRALRRVVLEALATVERQVRPIGAFRHIFVLAARPVPLDAERAEVFLVYQREPATPVAQDDHGPLPRGRLAPRTDVNVDFRAKRDI